MKCEICQVAPATYARKRNRQIEIFCKACAHNKRAQNFKFEIVKTQVFRANANPVPALHYTLNAETQRLTLKMPLPQPKNFLFVPNGFSRLFQ